MNNLKSLYISKKYFEEFPQKGKLAMMSDGEIYFFQLDEEDLIDEVKKDYPDIQEVVKLDQDLLIVAKDIESLTDIGFEQLIMKYEKGLISHYKF